VLLNRPAWHFDETTRIETVNDADGFVCNAWRGIQFAPEEVAKWCDWPVNHVDLMVRKKELLKNEDRLIENLVNDAEWFDAKLAGYWIWAACCWIGSGLTSLGQIPHLGDAGGGVHKSSITDIYSWFEALSTRLRRVRVTCGNWDIICGGNWQGNKTLKPVGIYFDPPYGVQDRRSKIYHHDSLDVATNVMRWSIERGKLESHRIVISGYEEHMELVEKHGWTCENWKANGGYARLVRNGKQDNQGKANCKREMIYYSPHCLSAAQNDLFTQG
jgi:hypothetical protein